MKRKCPPGVVCIENYTISFFVLILIVVLFYMWFQNRSNNNKSNNDFNSKSNNILNNASLSQSNGLDNLDIINRLKTTLMIKPSAGYTTNSQDVLMNPYAAPLRDDRPILPPPMQGGPYGLPINVPTQGVDAPYRQVGILTRINGPEMILPLMGKPLIPGRDKWNFYTMSDKNNMVKLPITYKNKNCSSEYGCDNVYNGDTVYVEGYNDAFKVTVYENSTMRYIPYI